MAEEEHKEEEQHQQQQQEQKQAEEAAPPPPAHTKPKMTEGKGGYGSQDARRYVCTFLVIFLLLAGVTTLIVWLVYRPHKPHFSVVGAAIYELNTTSPTIMSTTMQFTIVTRNPNKRVSIYYDHLSSYVSYRNQAITEPTILPALFHNKKSTVALSPILGGGLVPVSTEVMNGLLMDEAYGVVALRLVLMGRLRYKAGAIKSVRYGVIVKCDMLVGFKKGFVGQVPLLGSPDCNVDI